MSADPARGFWKLEAIVIILVLIAIAAFWRPFQLHTSAPSAADCPLPSEAETLLITVNVIDKRVVARCTFVGSRGSYARGKK